MDTGLIVIIVIVVLFYARLYLINRGKKRRERQAVIDRMKLGRKAPPMPVANPDEPAFHVKSWWLIAPAISIDAAGCRYFQPGIFARI